MVPGEDKSDKESNEKIDEFVKRIREAAGPNVESIILFGSAVSGDFHPGLSNLNLLCVLRDSSFAALQALAPVAKWWDRQKQPPPLCMTRRELERSTDVFTIELLDMQQHHRVLFGENVVQGLRDFHARSPRASGIRTAGEADSVAPADAAWQREAIRGCGTSCCTPCRRSAHCSAML